MLRTKQYIQQLLTIVLFYFITFSGLSQEKVNKTDSLIFKFKTNLSGTYDKSLVTRLLFNTQNSLVLKNKWLSFEPVINYRYGYVEPINRPKTDLENDLFITLKSHFWHQNILFPSIEGGYENSPNLRQLNHRIYGGIGFGGTIIDSKNQFIQVFLYGIYERSDFENLDYGVIRCMPIIKGKHYFEKKHIGFSYSFQPFLTFNKENNHRFRGLIKPYLKITPKLDFNITYDLWYETIVDGSQPNEISVILFGFNYSNF
jgi:hypothetical protein